MNVSAVMQPLSMHHEEPPTYFKTDKFTECFQSIVSAYGVARYREVNPAVFTIMTFPFLFAVMFGDVGHGILMLMFALFLLWNEKAFLKTKLDDMTSMAFSGRYCILLMALFSIFTGAIYNEFFSMPMNLGGGTRFKCYVGGEISGITDLRDCGIKGGQIGFPHETGPYPFGVDPSWKGTRTELPYLNSMKMKMSILMGVTHMNLGIFMSFLNNNFFKDRLSNWCEYFPQVIFLNALFGYLCLLMVYKWITGSVADLYHVMIYMFLSPGALADDDKGLLFKWQGELQVVLLLVSLVAVPWMLIPKPLILNARHKASLAGQAQYEELGDAADAEHASPPSGGHGDHAEFDISEVVVHQMIHTIEFVLGAVSNTASYLRLWALSLAHSQLSAVFFDRVLMMTVQMDNRFAMFIGWFVWALATLAVLMVMESLSAFLHAMRLHWVEFQNKFYRGDGYQFVPFSFKDMDASDESI